MMHVDVSDIEELEKDLKTFARKALPYATRNTVNSAAFRVQKLARENVKEDFILRNRFTVQSIQVRQAKTLNIDYQAAHVGSTADYLADQEFGSVKKKKGAEGVPIPTTYASGEAMDAPVRKRLPRRANTLQNIRLRKKTKAYKNKRQAMVRAVQEAVKSGNRFIFLELRKTKGIFKVVGGNKSVQRGWPKGAKLRLVHDMSRDQVTIPSNPWLQPAVAAVTMKIPELYRQSLIFQMKKHNLFKG